MSAWLDRKRDLLTEGFKLMGHVKLQKRKHLQIPSNRHKNSLNIIALDAKYTTLHLTKETSFIKCSACKSFLILLSNATTFVDFKCLECIWLVHANMKDVHAYKCASKPSRIAVKGSGKPFGFQLSELSWRETQRAISTFSSCTVASHSFIHRIWLSKQNFHVSPPAVAVRYEETVMNRPAD